MPKKPETPSLHTLRNIELRQKLTSLKKYVPTTNTHLTLHGEIAVQCAKIAADRDLKWYKSPKDMARCVRLFMEGERDLSWERLAVIDLYCADIEAQRRGGILERSGAALAGAAEWPAENAPVPAALLHVEKPQNGAQPVTQDPEIAALYAVNDALTDLDDYAIQRVLSWAVSKHGVRLA